MITAADRKVLWSGPCCQLALVLHITGANTSTGSRKNAPVTSSQILPPTVRKGLRKPPSPARLRAWLAQLRAPGWQRVHCQSRLRQCPPVVVQRGLARFPPTWPYRPCGRQRADRRPTPVRWIEASLRYTPAATKRVPACRRGRIPPLQPRPVAWDPGYDGSSGGHAGSLLASNGRCQLPDRRLRIKV